MNDFWTSSPSISAVSPLTFWCKFCIPLGTSFELLRLLFQQYLALHSLRNDFWAENLRCAPLGTAFCSFVVLCIPLGTSFELLPVFLFSRCTRWCMLSFYIYIFGGYCSCRADIRKRENIKSYIKLHIISPKLIRIPRSRNVVAVHILQPVGTGSWRRYY